MSQIEVSYSERSRAIALWVISLLILTIVLLWLGHATNIAEVVGKDPYLGVRYFAHIIVVLVVLIIGIAGWLASGKQPERSGLFKFE